MAWIQPDFFVVNKILLLSEKIIGLERFRVFLRTILKIFKRHSLEKIFEILQENILKGSKRISFLGNKKN